MATDTSKLAPRIIINEHAETAGVGGQPVWSAPVTLIFGFSPVGKTCEMVVCNSEMDILNEFGTPTTAAEKYFIDAGLRVVNQNATALMTRLPYDNPQSHMVKYIDFKVEEPMSMYDIATVPRESIARDKDENAVTVLKEMHNIDNNMNQLQRITPIGDEYGTHIFSMTNEELIDLELDPEDNLDEGVFRIVDIRGEQYGLGVGQVEYAGIFPVFVTAPMALYYQGRIQNRADLDDAFSLIDARNGIEMSTNWWKQANPLLDSVKLTQAKIVESISQNLNFDSTNNVFHRSNSFQDSCVRNFPSIHMQQPGKLDKQFLDQVGLLVCRLEWDADSQKTNLNILEAFVGKLGRAKGSLDQAVNKSSKYIRMYKNFSVPTETDFFVFDNQNIMSMGMEANECMKYVNYKTSIIDPITYMLESVYSDVDSVFIDTILDAGLTSTAFQAYIAKTDDGESFATNPEVRTTINWRQTAHDVDAEMEDYAKVWNEITRLFGDFIQNVRGDCVYLADGPRIANLERNYPIRNYTDLTNTEMFHKYLPLFNGYSNSYVARYWNWVYMEDMQYANNGIWVPGSVVMGSQLALNDNVGQVWFAPAGHTRGLIQNVYDVSVRTKQYNDENDILYQNHWNFFNVYQNEGVVVDGQKTMLTKHTALDRLNVRRMVCWVKQQARIIANKYKYEPHVSGVKDWFTNDISGMLSKVKSTNGISDFVVVCNNTNNNIQTLDNHELFMKIGIKPIHAIEYIVIDMVVGNGRVTMDDNMVVR